MPKKPHTPQLGGDVEQVLDRASLYEGHRVLLRELWEELNDRKLLVDFPFPANHGEPHVTQVLENMNTILPLANGEWGSQAVMEIIAATMIHDIGMYDMIDKGAYGEDARKSRINHASMSRLQDYTKDLAFFTKMKRLAKERILLMAYAHAADAQVSLLDKTDRLDKYVFQNPSHNYVLVAALALRVADLLDLGPDRLVPGHDKIDWKDDQRHHLIRHKFLEGRIDPNSRMASIIARLDKIKEDIADAEGISTDGSETVPTVLGATMEVLALYREIYEEANKHVNDLRKEWHVQKSSSPTLEPIDEMLYGTVLPLATGIQLFTREFSAAWDDFRAGMQNGVFCVDIMGHSQYGRLVLDSEGLNARIEKCLFDNQPGARAIRLRVLLLDPEMENQQMEEVYDAQIVREAQRSILPGYDQDWKVSDDREGDIWASLNKLQEWGDRLGLSVDFEVRLTRRIMYAAITRFGDRMVVSPYRGRGRFLASLAIKVTSQAPLFHAYESEFDSLWNEPFETRIYLLKDKRQNRNPVAERLRDKSKQAVPVLATRPFDYEISLIDDDMKLARIMSLLSGDEVALPPREIEVQPCAWCTLACQHCIGNYLGRPSRVGQPRGRGGRLASELLSWRGTGGKDLQFDSVLDYEVSDKNGNVHRVESVRISGLYGDPLESEAQSFTIDLIKKVKEKKRRAVLFTGGLGLSNAEVRDGLLGCMGTLPEVGDDIHLSLDAVKPETFSKLKGAREDDFEAICSGAAEIANRIRSLGRAIKFTVGFVVTQMNAQEVGDRGLQLAHELGAGVVRFKPDIRWPRSISYRTWVEFKKAIAAESPGTYGLAVALTDLPPGTSAPPAREKCWAQYFCPTVGPDGGIYLCDHLPGHVDEDEACLGSLYEEDFATIWKRGWPHLGKRRSCCYLCPPFNTRLNRFLWELDGMIRLNPAQTLREWLAKARDLYANQPQ